jgi:hypothetical protein
MKNIKTKETLSYVFTKSKLKNNLSYLEYLANNLMDQKHNIYYIP